MWIFILVYFWASNLFLHQSLRANYDEHLTQPLSLHFRNDGPECAQRLLCQANKEIFGRGHVLPSVMTYLSNLIISIIANDAKPSEILLAAQRGRKGKVNCLQFYPQCKLKL